ncbi:Type II toxin-antitoxin system prevent-host-death family antitoxin [Candidatus Magnetomoraceae bacterium gMMP-15]
MQLFDIYTLNDSKKLINDLIKDTENGRLALITKHGNPAFIAIPFDERLLAHGIDKAMAIHLFETELVSLSQAAQIASLSIEEFLEILAKTEISVVNYSPDELYDELEA